MAWLIAIPHHEEVLHTFQSLSYDGMRQITETDSKYLLFVNRQTRFEYDRVILHKNGQVLLVDGVLLNKQELYEQKHVDNMEELLYILSEEPVFWSRFRGPFSGFCLEPEEQHIIVYGNQTGDTSAFYYNDEDMFVASSDFNLLWKALRETKRQLTFNLIYANHMLSLGFVVEGNTVCNEVHCTQPGMMAECKNTNIMEREYHSFTNAHAKEMSMDDAIEMVDSAFRSAVKRCFDKDLEYGYSHLADMSGGLDSRMTNWVARDMGYENILNICYAKAGTNEVNFAQNVSLALGNEFVFRPSDDLKFMYDLESIVSSNYGLSIYCGITAGQRMLSTIDWGKFGLEHTGQLGDVLVGSYCHSPEEDLNGKEEELAYSDIISPLLCKWNHPKSFEIKALYVRGFSGILKTHFIRREFTEAVSPFLDVDFINTCLSIPLKLRCGHRLYWEWIRKKYPRAAELSATTPDPSKRKFNWRDAGRKVLGKYKRAVYSILIKCGMHSIVSNPNNMNPLDYWYYTQPKLKNFMNEYYESHINNMNFDCQLRDDIEQVWHGVRAADKCLALTVLAAYQIYFVDE